jgi:hypothetical protein
MNKFKCLFFSGLMAVMPACMNGQQTSSEDSSKPRVIITCDPELDDLNSLIRFLLFSTDFRVEGLIYASSQFHWKGDGHGTKWQWMILLLQILLLLFRLMPNRAIPFT